MTVLSERRAVSRSAGWLARGEREEYFALAGVRGSGLPACCLAQVGFGGERPQGPSEALGAPVGSSSGASKPHRQRATRTARPDQLSEAARRPADDRRTRRVAGRSYGASSPGAVRST